MIKRAKKNSSDRSGARGKYRTTRTISTSGSYLSLNSNSHYRWLSKPGWSYSGVSEHIKIETIRTVLG